MSLRKWNFSLMINSLFSLSTFFAFSSRTIFRMPFQWIKTLLDLCWIMCILFINYKMFQHINKLWNTNIASVSKSDIYGDQGRISTINICSCSAQSSVNEHRRQTETKLPLELFEVSLKQFVVYQECEWECLQSK